MINKNVLFMIALFILYISKASAEQCFYNLPFAINSTHRTLQGFNGSFSHTPPLEYAVDFEMSEGTKIFSARSGKVTAVKFDSKESGKDRSFIDKANYIRILHRDGTIGYYAHLKYNGVKVKKGQIVNSGEFIGLSGCTGFCDGAHLHFEVYKTSKNKFNRVTVPIIFWSKEGRVDEVKKQRRYTATKNHNPCL